MQSCRVTEINISAYLTDCLNTWKAVIETGLIINCYFPETMHPGSLKEHIAHWVTRVSKRDKSIRKDKKTEIK